MLLEKHAGGERSSWNKDNKNICGGIFSQSFLDYRQTARWHKDNSYCFIGVTLKMPLTTRDGNYSDINQSWKCFNDQWTAFNVMVIFIVVWVYLYFRKSEQKVNGSIVDTIFSIFCLFKPIKKEGKSKWFNIWWYFFSIFCFICTAKKGAKKINIFFTNNRFDHFK